MGEEGKKHLLVSDESGCWEQLLSQVAKAVIGQSDAARIIEGYRHLRTVFEFEPERGQVFLDYIVNLVPEALRESADRGHLLQAITHELGARQFNDIRRRLLSRDRGDVDSVLAELHVFGALRGRQLPVHFIRADAKGVAADILIEGASPVEVEVSRLGVPKTYADAVSLHEQLRQALQAILGMRPLFVDVTLDGYAADLCDHVGEVEAAFRAMLRDAPREPRQIVPGFTVITNPCSVPIVHVHGAKVHGSDLLGRGSPFRRLLVKLREKSEQVKEGGIVLVLTSALSELLEPEVLSTFVKHLLELGAERRNVASFVVLDEVIGLPRSDAVHQLGAATLTAAVKGLTLQRMLWVRNPQATIQEHPAYRMWFRLPF